MIKILRVTEAQRVALGGLAAGRFCWVTDTGILYLGTAGGDEIIDLHSQSTFINQDDTPAAYAGHAGKYLKVNAVPDAMEFGAFKGSFLTLGDTPAAFTPLQLIHTNLAGDALVSKLGPATCSCRVTMSGNQLNVGGAGDILIHFDTEDYDKGGNFNVGTYLFTTPVAGLYLVTVNGYTADLVDQDRIFMKVYYDGVTKFVDSMSSSGTNNLNCAVTGVFEAAAAKTIGGYWAGGGGQQDILASNSYMDITLLQETT